MMAELTEASPMLTKMPGAGYRKPPADIRKLTDKDRSDCEYMILGQCLATPEIIPYVAREFGHGEWEYDSGQAIRDYQRTRDHLYEFATPGMQRIWFLIFDFFIGGETEMLTALFHLSQWGLREPLHFGDTPESRRRPCIECARTLWFSENPPSVPEPSKTLDEQAAEAFRA